MGDHLTRMASAGSDGVDGWLEGGLAFLRHGPPKSKEQAEQERSKSISNGRSGWLPTPLVDLSFGTKVSCRRRSRVRLGNPSGIHTCWMTCTCPWHHRRPMHQEATAKSSRRPAPTAASSQHPGWWAALPPPIPSSRASLWRRD